MTARRPDRQPPERLVDALVPSAEPNHSGIAPAVLPVLPAARLPTGGAAGLLLDVARLDRSGRLSARGLLRALNWRPGHRLDIDVLHGAVVVTATATGRHAVGGRGELALPLATRQMCAITPGPPVILAASIPDEVLLIYPASTVAQLISEFNARLMGAHDAR